MPSVALSRVEHARRVLIAIGLVALALLLWRIADALLLAFAAVLLAVVLRSIATLLERHTPLSPRWSLLMTVLLLALGLGLLGWLVSAEVRAQAADLGQRLPQAWEAMEARLGGSRLGDRLLERAGDVVPSPGRILSSLSGATSSLAGGIGNLIIVVIGGLYIAAQPRLYRKGLLELAPPGARDALGDTLDACGLALQGWLAGQLLAMTLVAVLTTLGLWLIGLPSFLALGLLAGLAEFVPVVGSIMAAVPAILLALGLGADAAIWTALLYLSVQQLQGNVIQPLVMRHMVALPPALLLFAILAAGLVFGWLGVLLAAPLAVILFVAVKRLWLREALDEPVMLPGEERGKKAP